MFQASEKYGDISQLSDGGIRIFSLIYPKYHIPRVETLLCPWINSSLPPTKVTHY